MINILNGVTTQKLAGDTDFIVSLYGDEPYPVFEFSSYHILAYLSFGSTLYSIKNKSFEAVLIEKSDGELQLFTPRIINLVGFANWLKNNTSVSKILNVSENWLTNYFGGVKGQLVPRSKNEAIYDVEMLNFLSGKVFSKLRNTKRKLLDSNKLVFKKVDNNNLSKAYEVLDKWQKAQGHRYEKNKHAKEKHVYKKLLESSQKSENILFEIGFLDNVPFSLCALHKVEWKKGWGVIYLVKGINRSEDGGFHGVSDATYCHLFEVAKKWDLEFLNDGELGSEQGTAEHKLRFQPVKFLKSFDITLTK